MKSLIRLFIKKACCVFTGIEYADKLDRSTGGLLSQVTPHVLDRNKGIIIKTGMYKNVFFMLWRLEKVVL